MSPLQSLEDKLSYLSYPNGTMQPYIRERTRRERDDPPWCGITRSQSSRGVKKAFGKAIGTLGPLSRDWLCSRFITGEADKEGSDRYPFLILHLDLRFIKGQELSFHSHPFTDNKLYVHSLVCLLPLAWCWCKILKSGHCFIYYTLQTTTSESFLKRTVTQEGIY